MLRAVQNPPNPYSRYSVEWLDVPPVAELQVYEEEAKSILSKNDSPDIPFSYSVNPYRGCFHGCAYCYARRTHPYIDFGAGSDFERKIVAKVNAPALLEAALMKRSWQGETIIFSGVTDCYQPLEASYELTRRCLEVCVKFRNPVGIITKGALVRRDIDLLQELAKHAAVRVFISIPFIDDELSKIIEPFAPRSSTRFRALEELARAGIPVGVSVSPMIPGLGEANVAKVLERAAALGATSAFMTLLRLPGEVEEIFVNHIKSALPQRAEKIFSAIRDYRGGKLNQIEFGKRFTGSGERWEAIEWLFDSTCKRLGLNKRERTKSETPFRRPEPQLRLPGL